MDVKVSIKLIMSHVKQTRTIKLKTNSNDTVKILWKKYAEGSITINKLEKVY